LNYFGFETTAVELQVLGILGEKGTGYDFGSDLRGEVREF
jgi:hypothetical protein